MIGDHDHAVTGEELGALAVGRQEGALVAFESLRAVHGHALARHPVGQRIDLALDASGPLGVDVDQAAAGMVAAEGVAGRDQPALRVFVENDEILGWGNADHDLAELAPLVVDAEGGSHAPVRPARRCLRSA